VILNARCRLLTIRSCHPWFCFRVRANLRLSWPASAIIVRILGNNALNPPSSRAPARRSDVSAGSTRLATSRPSVSTRMWRLRPFTRLCAVVRPVAPSAALVQQKPTPRRSGRCRRIECSSYGPFEPDQRSFKTDIIFQTPSYDSPLEGVLVADWDPDAAVTARVAVLAGLAPAMDPDRPPRNVRVLSLQLFAE
jgi:hypothetical protein